MWDDGLAVQPLRRRAGEHHACARLRRPWAGISSGSSAALRAGPAANCAAYRLSRARARAPHTHTHTHTHTHARARARMSTGTRATSAAPSAPQRPRSAVDVVEARDARIGRSTAHPEIAEWVGDRPRVVVFTFADLAPPKVLSDWRAALDDDVFFVDARRGGDKEFRPRRCAAFIAESRQRKKKEEGHRAAVRARRRRGLPQRGQVGAHQPARGAQGGQVRGPRGRDREPRLGAVEVERRPAAALRAARLAGHHPRQTKLLLRQAALELLGGRLSSASTTRLALGLLMELRSSNYAPGAQENTRKIRPVPRRRPGFAPRN